MPYTYILRCADGTYYVGSTWDLARRLSQHQEGTGARYTARRRPVELLWSTEFERIEDAFALEKQLQGWSRTKREAYMAGRFDLLPELARGHGRGDAPSD